ncbi:sugar diacid utilization regulator [Saccharopolyspora phatthalungensis]|uniref:Sugar diacid utilization regulator n=1 Tax=Saccharopolyspora phatthalungensis TaxID=664693 RepID=A0A840QBF3_9PSEU|nr:sugar diacid utilization regulator [Saccharopolyspora phatthalungensis]
MIVLAPVGDPSSSARDDTGRPCVEADPVEERFRGFVQGRGDVHVGASQVVSLRETAAGYEQAFHALAAAKSGAEHYARFRPQEELAALLGQTGRDWAGKLLAPLIEYIPDRCHDPDAKELARTLQFWLMAYNVSAKALKIHRNTLSARLSHIERLLGCDLHQIRTQATLDLALRILHYPRSSSGDHQDSINALLNTAAVRLWAQRQLTPLLTDDAQQSLTTLRAWLASDARLDMTAAALEISVPGTRKRLLRVERLLQRSLLIGPSARYDLWLALRIHDGHDL